MEAVKNGRSVIIPNFRDNIPKQQMYNEKIWLSKEPDTLPQPEYKSIGLTAKDYDKLVENEGDNANAFAETVSFWQEYIDNVEKLHNLLDRLVGGDVGNLGDQPIELTTNPEDEVDEYEEEMDDQSRADTKRLDVSRVQLLVDAGNAFLDGKIDIKTISLCRDLVASAFSEARLTLLEQESIIADFTDLVKYLTGLRDAPKEKITEDELEALSDYQQLIEQAKETVVEYNARLRTTLQANHYISTFPLQIKNN